MPPSRLPARRRFRKPLQEFLTIRIFLFVVLAGLVALIGGTLMLGAFPPAPAPQAVEKVVPNDKFGPNDKPGSH